MINSHQVIQLLFRPVNSLIQQYKTVFSSVGIQSMQIVVLPPLRCFLSLSIGWETIKFHLYESVFITPSSSVALFTLINWVTHICRKFLPGFMVSHRILRSLTLSLISCHSHDLLGIFLKSHCPTACHILCHVYAAVCICCFASGSSKVHLTNYALNQCQWLGFWISSLTKVILLSKGK